MMQLYTSVESDPWDRDLAELKAENKRLRAIITDLERAMRAASKVLQPYVERSIAR